MSGMSDRASGARGKSRRKNLLVDLPTARSMLPLIQRIVNDIVQHSGELDRFRFEQDGLDRNKRELSWPERERRYAVQGEVSRLETRLEEERRELDSLGAVLFPVDNGRIGFPTVVNGRPAYFSWKIGEDGLNYWHFDGESTRRPIPASWNEVNQGKLQNQR